jgi:hypothetical protein
MLIPPTFASMPAPSPAANRTPAGRLATNPLTTASLAVCPECDTQLARASACLLCPACGWGKCG